MAGGARDFRSELRYAPRLPAARSLLARGREALVVYDLILEKTVPGFKAWVESFERRIGVEAGEDLKSLDFFPDVMSEIVELASGADRKSLTVVGIGGGSVLDFAGFAASILKRGVDFVSFPSTWLAAVDSAHGGKTALNVGGAKNQIGTFHPASRVWIVKELLMAQPEERSGEASAEVTKAGLLSGGAWAESWLKLKAVSKASLWKFLPKAIEAKRRILLKDPYETRGERELLNLGHTLGHVFEAAYGWPHGLAVAQGLRFAVEWSWSSGRLKPKDFLKVSRQLENLLPPPPAVERSLSAAAARSLLASDKKAAGGAKVRFVFVKGLGRATREEVKLDELLAEAQEQGWIE
jgi:3-dehydroquinate synthase